eukprot:m.221916 g.221916  ORF g.221916 m.221916 type:complete len:800 (-) comp15134_c0_seq9:3616-6015(-)
MKELEAINAQPTDVLIVSKKHYSRNVWMWTMLASTLVLLSLGGGVGISMVGRSFSKNCTFNECALQQVYQGCFGGQEFTGILLVTFITPLGVFTLGGLLIEFAHKHARWTRMAVAGSFAATATICLAIAISVFVIILRPWELYNYVDKAQTVLVNDVLQVFIGGFIFLTFLPLTAVCIALFKKLYSAPKIPIYSAALQHNMPTLTPANSSKDRTRLFLLLGFYVLLAFCCATFSAVWNYSAHSYFKHQSEYAILQVPVKKRFFFKLYQDTVVFYAFMAFIAIFGFVCHVVPVARKLMHKRIAIRKIIPLPNAYLPHALTVGETVLLLAVAGIYGYWLWFWSTGYNRIWNETQQSSAMPASCCNDDNPLSPDGKCYFPADPHARTQQWARVLGHMTSLTMYFLILPATRNSIWVHIFGIPFDRAIKYHRALGVLTWVLVTSHMLLWWIKWGMDKTLKNNMFTLKNLQITKELVHYDNFTVIVCEIAWLLMTIMVAVALWMRRKNYRIFTLTHYFGIIFYCVALMHAWTFWYYAAGGLFLWLFDKCLRIIRSATPVSVEGVSDCHGAGVTCLSFDTVTPFKFYPGQYAWICVPSISHLHWHPFTISSPPSAQTMTMHIKSQGPDTFTGQLYEIAKYNPESITLRIDGPYGRPYYFDQCGHVMLVAGGIGVTPMMSIACEIALRAQAHQSNGDITDVTIVWAVRDPALFQVFGEQLSLMRDVPNVRFHIHLYNTSDSSFQGGTSDVWVPVTQGRPDLDAIAKTCAAGQDTMLMACGPEALISKASECAFRFNFQFHHEVFHF